MRTRGGLFSQENKQLEDISAGTIASETSGDKALKSSQTDWAAMLSDVEDAVEIGSFGK